MKFSVIALASLLGLASQVIAAPVTVKETISKAPTTAVTPLLTRLTQLETGCRDDLQKISSTKEKDSKGDHTSDISNSFDSLLKKLQDCSKDIQSISKGHDDDGKSLSNEEIHILIMNLNVVQTVVGNTTSTCDDANNKYSKSGKAKLGPKVDKAKKAAKDVITPLVNYANKVADKCTGPKELVDSLRAAVKDTQKLAKREVEVEEEVEESD